MNQYVSKKYLKDLEERIRLGYDPNKISNELKWAFAKKEQRFNEKAQKQLRKTHTVPEHIYKKRRRESPL